MEKYQWKWIKVIGERYLIIARYFWFTITVFSIIGLWGQTARLAGAAMSSYLEYCFDQRPYLSFIVLLSSLVLGSWHCCYPQGRKINPALYGLSILCLCMSLLIILAMYHKKLISDQSAKAGVCAASIFFATGIAIRFHGADPRSSPALQTIAAFAVRHSHIIKNKIREIRKKK